MTGSLLLKKFFIKLFLQKKKISQYLINQNNLLLLLVLFHFPLISFSLHFPFCPCKQKHHPYNNLYNRIIKLKKKKVFQREKNGKE